MPLTAISLGHSNGSETKEKSAKIGMDCPRRGHIRGQQEGQNAGSDYRQGYSVADIVWVGLRLDFRSVEIVH